MMKKIYLGKVDGYESGKRNCDAYFEYELSEDGRFSMCAEVWKPNKSDVIMCGQCCDDVLEMVSNPTSKHKRMIEIWKLWHLNDMNAGCEHQRAAGWNNIRINHAELPESHANRDEGGILACWVTEKEHQKGVLSKACPVCGYKYGSAWLKEEIPEDVKKEIASW